MEHLSVANAQKCVLELAEVIGTESISLQETLGRVLAEEVRANRDLPPYDVSAMDGYAIRSIDLADRPATLSVIEDIKAGDIPLKMLNTGECARIMTGAPLPKGANAVIRVEDTRMLSDGRVQIHTRIGIGNDVRSKGESMRCGDIVLTPGTEIVPGVLGVLATVKHARVQVYCRPSVAILSTGNELEDLNESIDVQKIPDSNSYALMAQVQALGITPVLLGIARDEPDELSRSLAKGLEFDVLLVSGGTSVGVHDYLRPILESLGVRIVFWRVAMKPGHPVAFGTKTFATKSGCRDTFVFALPGNPVSSMVCFEQFVSPALRRMMGHVRLFRRTILARVTHDLRHQTGRTEFVRVKLAEREGCFVASSAGPQGSGMLLSMSSADGLMIIPADTIGVATGQMVAVQLLDGMMFQDGMWFEESV